MGYEVDEAYIRFTSKVDAALQGGARKAIKVADQTADAFDKSGKRIERVFGEATTRSIMGLARSAPRAAAAGQAVGEAAGAAIDRGVTSRTIGARDALGRILGGAVKPAHDAGEKAGEEFGKGVEEGLKDEAPKVMKTVDQLLAQVQQRMRARTARIELAVVADPSRAAQGARMLARAERAASTSIQRYAQERVATGSLSGAEATALAGGLRQTGVKAGEALAKAVKEGADAQAKTAKEAGEEVAEQYLAGFRDEYDRELAVLQQRLARKGITQKEFGKQKLQLDHRFDRRVLGQIDQMGGYSMLGDEKTASTFTSLSNSLKLSKDEGDGLSETLRKLGFSWQAVATAAAGFLALKIAQFISDARKEFKEFDSEMTKSLAIAGDISASMRGELGAEAMRTGLQLHQSATEAAKGYYYLSSAGLSAEEQLGALSVTATFAKAGDMELAKATELAADAQTSLGLRSQDTKKNLENLTRVTDVLVQAGNKSNASVEQFADALSNRAGAAAKSLGMDLVDVVALLAAFADQGVKGQIGGEATAQVLRDLQTAALKNREAFKAMHVEVFNAQGGFNNIQVIIAQLEGALGNLTDEQRRMALTELGFQDEVIGRIQQLLGSSGSIARYQTDFQNATGASAEVARRQMGSLSEQQKESEVRWQNLKIKAGEFFSPLERWTLGAGNSLLRNVGDPIDELIVKMRQLGRDTENTTLLLLMQREQQAYKARDEAQAQINNPPSAVLRLPATRGRYETRPATSVRDFFFGQRTTRGYGDDVGTPERLGSTETDLLQQRRVVQQSLAQLHARSRAISASNAEERAANAALQRQAVASIEAINRQIIALQTVKVTTTEIARAQEDLARARPRADLADQREAARAEREVLESQRTTVRGRPTSEQLRRQARIEVLRAQEARLEEQLNPTPVAPPQVAHAQTVSQLLAAAQEKLKQMTDQRDAEAAIELADTRSTARAQAVRNRWQAQINTQAREYMAQLKTAGATAAQQALIAKEVESDTRGEQVTARSERSADTAESQLAQQANLLRRIQTYWQDSATAPAALRAVVSDVLDIEKQIAQVEAERKNIAAAHRSTAEADDVLANLHRQQEIADQLVKTVAPLEAAFARGQADLNARRSQMSDAEAEAAGRELATAYDRGIADFVASNTASIEARATTLMTGPRRLARDQAIAEARATIEGVNAVMLSRQKGALNPAEVARSLMAGAAKVVAQGNTRDAVERILGADPEAAEAAGIESALQFLAGLREKLAAAEGDEALQEQLVKLLPNIDLRAAGLDQVFIAQGQGVIAALGGVDTAARKLAEAEQALRLVNVSQVASADERVAAERRLAAARRGFVVEADRIRRALLSAGLSDDQLAYVMDRIAKATSSANLPVRDMANSISSLAGKATLLEGVANAFGQIADAAGGSQALKDWLGGISSIAGAVRQLQAARKTYTASLTTNGGPGAGVSEVLGVLGGAGAVAGAVINMGRSIAAAGERQRIATIQATIASLEVRDALREFRRGEIATISQTERDRLLGMGESFIDKHALGPALEGAGNTNYTFKAGGPADTEFLKRLGDLIGHSLLDDQGRVNARDFVEAWKMFQESTLGSFGSDAAGQIERFEFLINQLGDSLGDTAARVKMLIASLRKASDLKGTAFADVLEKKFAEGGDAATKWLQDLIRDFAAGGPTADSLKALFGTSLSAEAIQRILEEALGQVAGGGAVGGGSNDTRLNVSMTEVQGNTLVMQNATMIEQGERMIAEMMRFATITPEQAYEIATGAPPVQPVPFPTPTVAQVAALTSGGGGGSIEIRIDSITIDQRGQQPAGADPRVLAEAAGTAIGRTLSERVATALRAQGANGRPKVTVRVGGIGQ